MSEPIYVSANVANEEERAIAKRYLRDVVEYPGIVEGRADEDALRDLAGANIVADVIGAPVPSSLRRSKRTDIDLRRIAETMEQLLARKVQASLQESIESIQTAAPALAVSSDTLDLVNITKAVAPRVVAYARGEKDEDAFRLTLKGSLRPDVEEALSGKGIVITSSRGDAFHVFLTPKQRTWLERQPFVAALDRYSLLDTVHTTLLVLMQRQESAKAKTEVQLFELMLHRPRDRKRVEKLIRQYAGKDAIIESAPHAIRFNARVDPTMLAAIADLPWVSSLMPCTPATLYSDRARAVIGLPESTVPFPWTGEGELVAVIDSGIDRSHLDLADRLEGEPISFQGCPVDDLVGHGTHVAGIIAGTGAAARAAGGPPLSGMAPGAKLVIVANVKLNGTKADPIIPADVTSLFDLAVKRKASIINVSWGRTEAHGKYDSTATSIDQYVRDHPEVLVVVAAGNEGQALEGSCEFNTVSTPASAKNVVTVGACATSREGIAETWGQRLKERFPQKTASDDPVAGDPGIIAGLSARGPTEFDGVKPDLVAPGTYILAPRSKRIADPKLIWRADTTNDYVYIGGTSMAAPVVAGSAAVLRHYLRVARKTAKPSAALLKAILLSAATPLASPRAQDQDFGFPDFDQGFGRLDLRSLLPPAADAKPPRTLALADVATASPRALDNKGKSSYSAFVRDGASGPLVVTLVWTDIAGKDVQNRLTLQVIGPGGPYRGNAKHKLTAASVLHPTAGDRRNNVQQVRIDDAQPGEYVATVTGLTIRQPPQSFALVFLGDLEKDTLEEL